jgi:glycosyltransferase involved in cell wall biosynthesis
MKIAILSTFESYGGAAIAAKRLQKALLKNGEIATMVVQEKTSTDNTIHSFSTTYFGKLLAKFRFALDRFLFVFSEKSKAVRFSFSTAKIGVNPNTNDQIKNTDIVHLHWINFGFLSLKSIEKINQPIVWTLHDMWAFTGGCHYSGNCENYKLECGNCVPFLKKPSDSDLSHEVWLKKQALFQHKKITFVTCSQWLADLAKTSALLKNQNVISIPNPINIDLFKLNNFSKKALYLDENKQFILFGAVNVADSRKGFIYLKEALNLLFEKIQNQSNLPEILIFGKANISDFSELKLKINFLGQLSDQQQIINAYNASTVFVIPSLEENLPNTIMESMACGTPVVGFEVGGIPEMIDHKKTGYLAKYKSAQDLSDGIFHILYEADYELISKNSRAKVVENYAEEIVAEQYQNLYESLLKNQ